MDLGALWGSPAQRGGAAASNAPAPLGESLAALLRSRLGPILEVFAELIEDSSPLLGLHASTGRGLADLAGAAGLVVALTGLATPTLPLLAWAPAGSSLPVLMPSSIAGLLTAKKISLFTVSFVLLGSSVIWHRQEKTPGGQLVCRLSSAVLLTSSGAHSIFIAFYGSSLCSEWCTACPFVALRHLQELVASPLWVISLGYARDARLKDMLQTICFSVLGIGGQLGAAVACTPALQWGLLGLSATCVGVAAVQVSQDLPEASALTMPSESKRRLLRCGNVLALHWLLGCVIQCLGLAHAVDEPQQMLEFALLDLLLKLGGCHLLTKPAPPRARPPGLELPPPEPDSSSETDWGTPRA